jgi:hypothetical protein
MFLTAISAKEYRLTYPFLALRTVPTQKNESSFGKIQKNSVSTKLYNIFSLHLSTPKYQLRFRHFFLYFLEL